MKVTFCIESGNIDSEGNQVVLSGVIFKNPVIVTKDFRSDKIICRAEVSHRDRVLIATGEIGTEFMTLTPAIGFKIIKEHNDGNTRVLDKIELLNIGLCTSGNTDPSIRSIKDQLEMRKV